MKKYIALRKNDKATHLKVEVYYSLGGYNFFTYKNENRGYYLRVSPVSRSNINGSTYDSYTAFTGVKQCIKKVSRKSAKAEAEAEKLAAEAEPGLIDYILQRSGLHLAKGALV